MRMEVGGSRMDQKPPLDEVTLITAFCYQSQNFLVPMIHSHYMSDDSFSLAAGYRFPSVIARALILNQLAKYV